MDLNKIPVGENAPEEVNAIIEVPMNSMPVKYEFDKSSEAIFVDRFLSTPMFYPVNYGFLPHTLSGDGDPVDALVLAPHAVVTNSVITCRPIGVLKMEDEKGEDEKILFVPTRSLTKLYDDINDYTDLPEVLIEQIGHFFERYKDLEKGKWVKISGWGDKSEAKKMILDGIERHNASK